MIPLKDERKPATDDEMAEMLSDAAAEQWAIHRENNPKIQPLIDDLRDGVLTAEQFAEAIFGIGWMIGYIGGVSFGITLASGGPSSSKVN